MKKLIFSLFIIIMFILAGYDISVNTSSKPNTNIIQSNFIVTKSEYDQINNGMTYEQVITIIGGEGDKVGGDIGNPGDKYYMVTYQYNGKGDPRANANFTFEGGKLIAKAQAGLK